MRKIFLKMSLIFLICSCSKDEEESIPTEKQVTLDLKLLSVSNGHVLNNVRVGDTLTYKYNISSNISEGNFKIVPSLSGALYHDVLNTDFSIFNNNILCDTIKCTNKIGQFKILVKKAGNFQHKYTALNMVPGPNTPIIKSLPVDISFNAVRIIAYRYQWEWDRRGSFVFGYRYYYRHFHKLFIDCGNQNSDNYLVGLNYNVVFGNYNNNYNTLPMNTSVNFHPYEETDSGNGPTVSAGLINKLTFHKTINGIKTTIEYDNIPVPNWGRQDSWTWDGTNNL